VTREKALKLGRKIARDLFTNGMKQRAWRLVLEAPNQHYDGLGGWSETAIAHRIADHLAALSEGK